jgi:rare lipoprotein A
VVRVNDRGPYTAKVKIIDLSRAAADRLNLSNNTKVRIDFINVAPDGTMTGPGTIGTTVAKQSYALPARPTIGLQQTWELPGFHESIGIRYSSRRTPCGKSNACDHE